MSEPRTSSTSVGLKLLAALLALVAAACAWVVVAIYVADTIRG